MVLRDRGYRLSDDAIRRGIVHAHWPGRMELINIACAGAEGRGKTLHFLLDGAHNEAGVMHLLRYIENRRDQGSVFLVWASMADKTYGAMLKKIAALVDYILLTPSRQRTIGDVIGACRSHWLGHFPRSHSLQRKCRGCLPGELQQGRR